MNRATIMLFLLSITCGLSAALPQGEEIEFRFEPSFQDGTLIWLARLPDGKIHCSAYTLTMVENGGVASHSKAKPKLLKEVVVSAEDFDALVSALEAKGLRSEAETSEPVGIDGTSWMFRRKAGGRVLELRFWSPEMKKGSAAFALGAQFAAIARLDAALPQESQDPHGDAPTVVPVAPFPQPQK
jgi:hypothetical protein